MKPTNKLRAISEQALKNLTTRHTRLVPTERSLPDPQMLKDFLQLDLPHGDPRTRRLDHAADIWYLRAIAIAAQRAGIPFSLSTMATTSIEEVAAAAPNGRRKFQLYLWKTTATKHTN